MAIFLLILFQEAEEVTGIVSKAVMKPSKIRSLSIVAVLKRLREILPNLREYFLVIIPNSLDIIYIITRTSLNSHIFLEYILLISSIIYFFPRRIVYHKILYIYLSNYKIIFLKEFCCSFAVLSYKDDESYNISKKLHYIFSVVVFQVTNIFYYYSLQFTYCL
jgi:hypothetical protein